MICVITCAGSSLRVAWLCYETHYVSIIPPRNDIFTFNGRVVFGFHLDYRVSGTEPRGAPGISTRHLDPASAIDLLIKSRLREKTRMEKISFRVCKRWIKSTELLISMDILSESDNS